jgi:hypothetical protein
MRLSCSPSTHGLVRLNRCALALALALALCLSLSLYLYLLLYLYAPQNGTYKAFIIIMYT